MRKPLICSQRRIEKTVRDLLKSKAKASIYLYLLRKNGARSDQIIKGAKLHPSTVRETLSKMYDQRIIYRQKIKTDTIGKNPYFYYAVPPVQLIKRYSKELEERLNTFALIDYSSKNKSEYKPVKIQVHEREGKT